MSDQSLIDFQLIVENNADIVCLVRTDHVCHLVSASSLLVLGWTPGEMNGKPLDDFVLREDRRILAATLNQDSPALDQTITARIRMTRKDGSSVWIEYRARRAANLITRESLGFIVITIRDISKQKRREEKLSALALRDSLTSLLNRRAFNEALDREWKRALRERSELSLLLLDVDHFKELNDRYGHKAGDECLRTIASVVREATRATDVAARLGGDELVIICPSTDIGGAVQAAERIRSRIEALQIPNPGNAEGRSWVTASIGVASVLGRKTIAAPMSMPESLLESADAALYQAKGEGRNRVANGRLDPEPSVA